MDNNKLSSCSIFWMLALLCVSGLASAWGVNATNVEQIEDEELVNNNNHRLLRRATPDPQITVISPGYIYFGLESRLVIQVNTDMHNLTLRVAPVNRSCVVLHEQNYSRLSPGEDYLLPFTLRPTHHLLNQTVLSVLLVTGHTLLYEGLLLTKYPHVKLWTNQRNYSPLDKVKLWAYTYSGSALPVAQVHLSLILSSISTGLVLESINATTDGFGLLESEFTTIDLDIEDEYLITAQHLHQNKAAAETQISTLYKNVPRRQLEVEITTEGYHIRDAIMLLKVKIRRPGVDRFNGRVKLTYCAMLLRQPCVTIKLNIPYGEKLFAVELGSSVGHLQEEKLNVSATIIEHKTGIVELIDLELDIYPHKLEILTYNLPATYVPGESLRLPFMVLHKDNPAVDKCIVILISTAESLLYTDQLTTNSSGEIIAEWTVGSVVSEDLIIEATDCHRNQPTAINHTVRKSNQSADGLTRLHSSHYRYHIGDSIGVSITGQLNHNLLIQKCGDGLIIGMIYPQNSSLEFMATSGMYPCIHVFALNQSNPTSKLGILSPVVTYLIDRSSSYQLIADSFEYPAGDVASLYLLPNDSIPHRVVVLASTTTNMESASINQITAIKTDWRLTDELVESQRSIDYHSSGMTVCGAALHYMTASSHSADGMVRHNTMTLDPLLARQLPDTVGTGPLLLGESTTQYMTTSHLTSNSRTTGSHRDRLVNSSSSEQFRQSLISTTLQSSYTKLNTVISSRSQSTAATITSTLPTTASSTTMPERRVTALPRMNWLPSNSRYRDLGLPEHWFSSNLETDSTSGRKKRDALHVCQTMLRTENPTEIERCSDGSFRLQLPSYEPSDWMVTGLLVTPQFGLQMLQPVRVHTQMKTYLAIKSPPADLTEGEQFQIHISVITNRPLQPIYAHIKLLLSSEEAFCFKNLILNTYPHVNVTIGHAHTITATSFTATALRRGNFTVSVELWIDEQRIHVASVPLEVSALLLPDDEYDSDTTSSIEESSTVLTPSLADSANLQLKMRYSKEDNLQRCKGFRLKVNHSILPPSDSSSIFGFDPLSDDFRRRKRAITPHVISSVPRHSLKICYRILQKTTRGSYYIDIESFTGYKPANDLQLESGDGGCRIQDEDIDTYMYDRGRIVMVKNSVGNHSWCCFSLVLESTQTDSTLFHTQLNRSASVRMHDTNSPRDFCLEFYNLQSENPYSNHICSQHGCLCTEESTSTCKQIRTHSTRKATLILAKIYVAARYAFKVTVASQGELNEHGFTTQVLTVQESYGNTHIDTSQQLQIFYKHKRRSCQLFNINTTYIIMGRQLHIQHEGQASASLYLDHQSSVISMEELRQRSDYASIECFLNSLLCRTTSASTVTSAPHTTRSTQVLASLINSNCRSRSALEASGHLDWYTSRYSSQDNQCNSDMSHVHKERRIHQSIRRQRRRNRQRRHRA